MPKKRPPKVIWKVLRRIVWKRDKGLCVRCQKSVNLKEAHIDHKISGKLGSNKLNNLRTLCRACHVLRADIRHRGMVAKALKNGIIPPNWREYIWE